MAQQLRTAWIAMAVLAAAMSIAACDDSGGGPRTNQMVSSPSAALPMRVAPIQLQLAHVVPDATCPMTQPFMTHFDLALGPPSADVFVDDVTLRFDGAASSIVFTRPELERLFGSTQVKFGSTRTFTFTPQFGCGFASAPGSLALVVTAIDGNGLKHEASATATIQ